MVLHYWQAIVWLIVDYFCIFVIILDILINFWPTASQCAVFGVFGVTGVLKDTAILFSKALEKYHTDCGLSETRCNYNKL